MATLRKILLITHEVAPFSNGSTMAKMVYRIAGAFIKKGVEVRIFAPRFGSIKQGKYYMHEVFRLSGINIPINNEEVSLLVKVGSVPRERLQVYFLDNERLFQGRGMFADEHGVFYSDNHTRMIFFCKSVLAAIQCLEWIPDIVHCHGWMTALIPLYLKVAYSQLPNFEHIKSIYTAYEDLCFAGCLSPSLAEHALMKDIKKTHLQAALPFDFPGLNCLGGMYADLQTVVPHNSHLSAPHQEKVAPTPPSQHMPIDSDPYEYYKNMYQLLLNS